MAVSRRTLSLLAPLTASLVLLAGATDASALGTVPSLGYNGSPVDVGTPVPITLTGAIPGGQVNFYFDGQLSTYTADSGGNVTDVDGEFVNLAPVSIPVGHHSAYATTVDAGIESDPSAPAAFDVRPLSPQFGLQDGAHVNTGVQALAITGVDPDAEEVTVYDTTDDGSTVIAGTDADVDPDGTATVPVSLADGHHHLSVAQTVNDVESLERGIGSNGVSIMSAAPALSAIATPTNDATPAFEVAGVLGNNGNNINQLKLYVDGQLTSSESLGGGDSTGAAPDSDLADGAHTAYVTTVDDLGHEGVPSNTVSFTVDTVAPVLAFTAPTSGQTLATATPTFTVHTEAGLAVQLFLGDGTDVTLTADADGNASYTAVQPLRDGTRTYGAYATDAAGNRGAEVVGTVVIDTFAPDNGVGQPQPIVIPAPAPAPAPTAAPVAPKSTPVPPTAAPVKTAAALPAPARLTLSSQTLTAKKPVKVGFTLSKPGTVKLTLTRTVNGKTTTVATVSVKVKKAGKGSITLKTKVGKKTLARGGYKLTLQTVSGKKTSKKVTEKLTVK